MIFTTLAFLAFLLILLPVYWALRDDRWRQWLLLAGNLFFYGWWDWRFTVLLLAVILISWASGLAIGRAGSGSRRALVWMYGACTSLLLVLGYFKYANFFLGSLQAAVRQFGGEVSWTTLNIILPAGISFYIFQAISYLVSVYRGKVGSEPSVVRLGVYLSFFPHLVAGPIIHAGYFLPQLESKRRYDAALFFEGARKFSIGFLYKAVFADNLAPLVDAVFRAPAAHSNLSVFGGCLAFYGQIYFDFAGYSLMAIGISNMFGYLLPDNFNHPYRASSVIDFWHRWHISLSTWLRDYVYIPLGGNRGSRLFQYRNVVVTMFLGGLWHGASWNFVLWGLIHAAALCVNHEWRAWRDGRWTQCPPAIAFFGRLGGILLTQTIVFLCWIPFRATSFADSWAIFGSLGRLIAGNPGAAIAFPWLLAALPLLADTWLVGQSRWRDRFAFHSNTALYVVLLLALLVGLLFMHVGSVPFIYFQF